MNTAAERPIGVIPNPDPSIITTRAIEKEVEHVLNLLTVRQDEMQRAIDVFHEDLTRVPTAVDRAIQGLRDLIDARLQSVQHDIKAVRDIVERQHIESIEQNTHLRDLARSELSKMNALSEERFKHIENLFAERDKRADHLNSANKTAIEAALQAQKEAAGATSESITAALAKMETNFTRLIDQGSTLTQSFSKNTDEKISDLRDRLTAMENRTAGMTAATVESREVRATTLSSGYYIAAAVGVVFSMVLGLVSLIWNLHK